MNQRIGIEVDPRTGKLRVTCPYWANDVLAELDAKSWSKAQRGWLIPISQATLDYLNKHVIHPGFADMSDDARRVFKNGCKAPVAKGEGFPAWYKFKTQPRKHQVAALKKYDIPALALFMIMRAGKTKVIIDIASALMLEGKIDSMLVVCKLSVRKTWQNEFTTHCPVDWDMCLPYTDRERAFNSWCIDPHPFKIMVVGTESFSQGRMDDLCRHFLNGKRKAMMVVDESWQIEGHKAERADVCIELGRMKNVKYRAITNGSALDDHPLKLFMQYEFLDSNIIGIGDYLAFRNRYAVMGGYRVQIRPGKYVPTKVVGYQKLEELMKKLAPYTVEVGEGELDLPAKVYERRHVQATKAQRDLYQQMRKTGEYTWNNENIVLKNVLELELRLHQLAGGHTASRVKDPISHKEVVQHHAVVKPAQNPKVREVLGIVQEAGKKQGVIWCAYKVEIEEVMAALVEAGVACTPIHGGVDEEQRERNRLDFQSGKYQYIVGNTQTGGAGLDMSAATVMIFYSNTNKIVDRTQSEMRPQAIGKKSSLLIVDILMEDTVDELRMEATEQKQDLAEYLKARLRECIAAIRGEPA